MSISIGTRLGAYEILQPIGQGGMGQVFRARDTRLQRDVAVKLVRPDVFNADRAERFRREARALAALGHQNIASVADHDTFTAATREGVVIGTAAYMSPEQARGQEVDRRTDIWSFGCCSSRC
jgi:serine/threonine protein kinase